MVLRHRPEAIGLAIERNGGWADVDELIAKVCSASRYHLDRPLLERIVETDSKGRYSFSADGTRIRANQGHSIDVVMDMEHRTPPETLYHGTAARFLGSIREKGLLPGNRQYVHLSPDEETARKVGFRHSKPEPPVVLRVRAGDMARDGYDFMISDNGVWQIPHVPPQYLSERPESGETPPAGDALVVRKAVRADLEAVNAIRAQVHRLHADGRPDVFAPEFGDALAGLLYEMFDDETRRVVVAAQDGAVVGFAVLELIDSPASPYKVPRRFLRVSELGVDEAHRRQGVGSGLFTFIRSFAAAQGFDVVELDMWEFNQDALRFYEAQGFTTYRRYMMCRL